MTDSDNLKWLWSKSYDSSQKLKILEGVAARADSETLKWFWSNTYDSSQKAKILEGVAARADSETLKWFWSNTYDSSQKDILLDALARQGSKKVSGEPSSIPNVNERRRGMGVFQYDLFISHASEDKDSFVRELAQQLKTSGLQVWYDEFTLTLGDSLRRSIDHGLANSRFGAVVLSPSFFKKEWPQKELDGLVSREDGKEKVILPIWHQISKKEIMRSSPILADRLAVSSSGGVASVVKEILRVINWV